MANKINSKTFVVLLSREEALSEARVDLWFKENGYVTWKATDFQHAMEELSDYTVEKRPHVVLLSVNSLPQRFEMIRTTLKACSGSDMTVLGFGNPATRKADNQYFAYDLDHLECLIRKESQSHYHLN